MMVATFLGLLVPFTFTVLTKYLVDYLVLNASESLEQEVYASIAPHKSEYFGSDLQHPPTSLSSTTTITTRRLILHDYLITGVDHHRFQATTTPVLMLMFMGQAAVMCSILSCMWLTISAHTHARMRVHTPHTQTHRHTHTPHTHTHTHTCTYCTPGHLPMYHVRMNSTSYVWN